MSICRAALAIALLAPLARAQEAADPGWTIVLDPPTLAMEVGDRAVLSATVVDREGEPVDERVVFYSRRRRSVSIDDEGNVEALRPGVTVLVARTLRKNGYRATAELSVDVAFPPLASVEVEGAPPTLYVGVPLRLRTRVVDAAETVRDEVDVQITSSDGSVAAVDAHGTIYGAMPGRCTVTVMAGDVSTSFGLEVVENPVASIDLQLSGTTVRTGDVVAVTHLAAAPDGSPIPDAPVEFGFRAEPDDDLGPAASGQITTRGKFVAETPGLYTLFATCGGVSAERKLRVEPRDVQKKIELVGQGQVGDTHTSDLWVWEGVDGRDYAVTGTWGANGDAHFWDVTDPSSIERISTVTVDARTVNDVKVSQDGALCVLSREGASNRKNGIVLIDVTNPREPSILAEYTENLTGGVHNLFIDGDHVYALSAARRYDVIDVSDPTAPRTVGSFELETKGHSIHDVWIEDGIAYSSNWGDGVVMVDVGNGVAGGSPENPVEIGRYDYPSGWNHAAFPYRDSVTGRFYVVAGDEAFPYGLNVKDRPTYPRGWIHFIDFTDPTAPEEVARYEVPEAGTHNLWIEGETLYVAYYNGGVRVVDISGELLGDLYRQGREQAFFIPDDPEGYIPNAPMTWGPQPHKGHVFFSDWNSGLWAVKVTPGGVQ